ncbi:hypothetical protein BsWGS_26935 [Bradybaena similaris]
MDYFGNAEMILWPPLAGDYSFDEIPDYDGSLDLTIESRPEYNADSSFQQQEKYPATREEMINWQEQIRMIHLRSHLNKLLETVTQAQYLVDKTSEELKKCHCQIEQHEDERDRLYKELETKESEGNRPAVQRLQAAFRQVCKNLQAEKTLEGLIRERLEQAQYELALAEVERGKFILAEDDLLQRENQLASDKARMAAIRLKKEEFMTRQALVSKKNDKRKWEDAVNEAEKRHIHAVEEAEKSHERANKYLSKTLAKLKKRQQEEQDRYNEDMTRKMDMLLKLKKDIANNRENLRVIRARNLGQEREKMAKEQEEMNKLLALGGNAEEMMIIKKRKNEMEKKKQQFEAEQKLKKAKVLEKILREEENIKRKIQLQPYLFDDDDREKALRVCLRKKKLPKSLLECIEVASRPDEVGTVDDEKQKEIQGEPDPATVPKKRSINRSKNKDDNEDEYMFMERAYVPDEDEIIPADEDLMEENEEEGSEEEDSSYFRALENTHLTEEKEEDLDEEDEEIQMDLAKPEFEGLWDKETKAYKSGKYADDPSAKPVNGSKMEKEILKKTLEKTREGIVKPQVAAGREFSGQPFYSKPSVIHFKDLVVGKTYKKKVILTNVSYSVNYIRFLEVSDSLKDFIKITFEPPGQMSAGMSCEMTVTFKPLINVDLSGEIHFLAQTGPFHVPLSCSTRKCDLSVDTTVVQFGTSVIGETLKRSFVLTNRGSLGTRFQFVKGTEIMPERIVPETSQDQSISEVVASAASKDASAEAAGSVESLKQNQQQAFFDHDNKSREVIHDSTVASGRVKLDSETLHWLSSTTLPIKHPSTTHQSRTVLEQSSGVSFQRDVGKASLEANDVPHVVDKVSEVDEYEMDEAEYFTESPEKSDHEPSKVSLEESMPRLVPSEEEDIGSLDGMMPGPLVAGEIGPYSSVLLEIVWQPTLTGDVKTEFTIFFADSQMEPISIFAVANAVDVPVWLERQTVDMKICMFDRLYQDTIIINSRATTSLRLQFEVCKELRNHLELLPKTGFIQAHSQFPAQLKFLPRQSLFQEAAEFFDPDTGVLEAPMTVRVAGQVTPVCFIMQAVVTTTDLEFGVCDLDFGCCTVHESVKRRFTLTNKSILPQQFGFVGLPDCLEVQPNDGFGTLLPLETLHLDVIFSPKAAKEYKMNLLCKTLINRRFSIPCQGVGVLTPLELSKQVINFSATSVNDTSTTALYVINSHTNANEYTHPVPRIGTGEIFPVGPTSFEFKVPKDAPITISPSVGTVLPGQKVLVEVRFSPVLDSDDIRLEALNIKAKLQAEKQEKERKEAEEREKREQEMASVSKKKSSTTTMSSTFRSKSKTTVTTMATPSSTTMPGLDKMSLSLDSSIQHAAITALLRQFKGYLQSVTVPCYIAAGRAGGPGELNYSIHNTLYLEIHCPAVKPQLIVVSDEGRQTIDFGSISVGQTYSKSVTVQNICDKQLKLRATILDPMGPFQVRNACRELSPGETHTILFTFTPNKDQIFQEKLRIETLNSTLHLTLKGCGANPAVGLSVEDGVLDMKAVLVGEFVEKSFTMRNLSNLPIEFIIKQDSLSHLRHIKAQNIPPFLGTPEPHNTRNYVGPQNKSGRNVFDLVPATGTITAGETKEIVVTFAPDHESDLFSDGVRIDLFSQKCVSKGQEESYFFQVVGQAKSQIIYLEGCDPLQPPVLSLACLPKPLEDEEGSGSIVMSPPVLITMQTLMGTDFYERCTRQIFVGCVQTMPGAPHRSGEFTLDGTQKDGTQKDGTQKDGTHKDGTPKDGTHKDGTPKDGTHKDGTPKDGTHKDGTHKDGIHKDGIHKDGIHKDGIQDLVQKSFTIQPTKGSVESGSKKAIVIAWLPPPDHDPKKVIEETMILTLKGDNITEQIPVVIRARTVQSE